MRLFARIAAVAVLISATHAFTEECDVVAVRYQLSVKNAVSSFHTAVLKAQERLTSQQLSLIGSGEALDFISKPLYDVANLTAEVTNLLDEQNDANMTLLNNALPAGISVGCQVDVTTKDIYLKLNVLATATPSFSTSLQQLPAGDLSALGLSFTNANLNLAGSLSLNGTVEIDVTSKAVAVRVNNLQAHLSAAGAVDTTVTWKDAGSVSVTGSVDLTNVIIPIVFPSTSSLTDLAQRLTEVRLGTLSGQMAGNLQVGIAVNAIPVGQLPSPILLVTDDNLFDTKLPTVSVDANIAALQTALVASFQQLARIDLDLGSLGLSGLELPGVNVSQLVNGVSDMMKLAPVVEQYYLLASELAQEPTFSGLVAFLKENLPVPELTSSVGYNGIVLTGGWFPETGEVALNIRADLGTTVSLGSFGGTVSNVLGDMQQLGVLFELIGVTAPAQSLAVPDFSASVDFSADIVVDATVGLKTEFINTGKLSGEGLAGSAFLRVNDLSAAVRIAVDPVNFKAALPFDTTIEIADASFQAELGFRAAFSKAVAEPDPNTPVTAGTALPSVEITVLELISGGTNAVSNFLKQLQIEVYAALDVVVPVQLSSAFLGDRSLSPIVELHDETLLSGGLPKFSLDIDLSFLVPSLPGGSGGSGNQLTGVFEKLTSLFDDLSGISLPTGGSLPNVPALGNLLKSVGGKLSFTTMLDEYLDLLVKFRKLTNSLDFSLTLDTSLAEPLVDSLTFNLQILSNLKVRFPTVFADFDGLENPLTNKTFSVWGLDFLPYVQVEFGLSLTVASADKSFGRQELIWFLATNLDYGLMPDTAVGLIRLLGLGATFPDFDTAGYPINAQLQRFNPLDHLTNLRSLLGVSSVTFNLGSLGSLLGSSVPTLGVNIDFQKAMFQLLSTRFPELSTKFDGVSFDGLPISAVSGEVFDWRSYLPQVGSVLGLGSSLSLSDLSGLFGKRPTIQGLVRFLKSRLLDGLSTGLTIGGTTFSGGLTSIDGRMELAARMALVIDTPSITPSEVVQSLEDALGGLFSMIGQDNVIGSIGAISGPLKNQLSGLDSVLAFGASVVLDVEAGLDIQPLIKPTAQGSRVPQLFARVHAFTFNVSVAVTDFSATLNFGPDFDFTALINTNLTFAAVSNASAGSPVVLWDQAAGQSFSISPLTESFSLAGSLVGDVRLSAGPLPGALYLGVEDLALFDSQKAKFSVDVEIPKELVQVLQSALKGLGDIGRAINSFPALSTTLPLVNRTLNELLKNGATNEGGDWGDFFIYDTLLDEVLADPAYAGCTSGTTVCPKARETLAVFRKAMANRTAGSFTADGGVPPTFVTGGMVGSEFQFGFGVGGSLEILVTPPLGELIEEDAFEFSGTGLLAVRVNFGFGLDVKVDTSAGLTNVTLSDVVVRLHNFTVDVEIQADVSATVSIGIASASISGGSGLLAASFTGSLNQGLPTAVADITMSKFTFDKTATLDACLPFSAEIAGKDLGALVGATEKPQICVNDSNLFESPSPTITPKFMDRLLDFRGLTPIQILGLVRGVVNIVQEYRETPVFDLPIPFTDIDLGDMLDFADALAASLTAKMLRAQDAADRTTLTLCLEALELTPGWNVSGTNETAAFADNLKNKVMSVVLNEQVEVELELDTTALAAVTSLDVLATKLNEALFAAGFGPSVKASVIPGVDALQLCTNETIKATDLRVQIALKKTGNQAYTASADAVVAYTMLGFTHGDVKEVPRVPAFQTVPELVVVLAELMGLPEGALKVTYEDPNNAGQYELLFKLELPLTLPTPAATLKLGLEVEPLLEVNASAQIQLDTRATIGFELGVRMGTPAGNLSLQATPKDPLGVNFTTASELNFTLRVDNDRFVVVLRTGKVFIDELTEQIAAIQPGGNVVLSVLNYKNSTFLIKSTYAKRLEVISTPAFEAASGLSSDKTKALLFQPIIRDLYFDAKSVLSVTNINLEATLAILQASSYGGNGFISLHAIAAFGAPGQTLALSDIRDAIVEDPFSVLAANATVNSGLDIQVDVTVPGTPLAVSGDVAVSMNPPFFVELQPNFTLPNASDFVVAVSGPLDLPNFKNLSLADIVGLIADGVDIMFGNEAKGIAGLLTGLDILDIEIPLVSVTPRTVVTELQKALQEIEGILQNPSGGIKRLELLVEAKLGLTDDNDPACTGSCLVEFKYANKELILALQYTVAPPTLPKLSLDMNLPDLLDLAGITLDQDVQDVLGDFVDLEAKLEFQFEGYAGAYLELGIDISSFPYRPFIGGKTGVALSIQANATGDLKMSLGPLEFGITNGKVSLDDGEMVPGPAKLSYGLVEGDRHYLSNGFRPIIDAFTLQHVGRVEVDLPITGLPESMMIEIPSITDFLNRDKGGNTSNLVVFKGSKIQDMFNSLTLGLKKLNPLEALLTDKEAIVTGIENMFAKVELAVTAADGVLGSLNAPIVKDKIRTTIKRDFIGSFKPELVTNVRARLNQLTGSDANANVASALRDVMTDLLGTKYGILKQDINLVIKEKPSTEFPFGKDISATVLDPVTGIKLPGASLETADALEWQVKLGKDILFEDAFDFDLGMDELPLKLDVQGGVKLLVGWNFNLYFGVSVSRGFYLNVEGDEGSDGTDMEVYAGLTLPGLTASGELFILKASVVNLDEVTRLLGRVSVDLTEENGDGALTFREIKSGGASLIRAQAVFEAALGMKLTLGLKGVEGLPEFSTEIFSYYSAEWKKPSTRGLKKGTVAALPAANETIPSEGFPSPTFILNDVSLDLGEFVSSVLKPIFGKLAGFLGPIKPILDALSAPLPVISDLARRDLSLLELPEVLLNGLLGAGGPVRGSVKNVLGYVNAVKEVIELAILVIDVITDLANFQGNLKLSFGTWEIKKSGPERYSGGLTLPAGFTPVKRQAVVLDDSKPSSDASNKGPSSMKGLFKKLTDPNAIFNLPFLSPKGVLALITGKDVDLFVVNSPVMEIDVTIDFWFPIAAGIIVVDFYGSFQFRARISMGYDTSGIRRAIEQKDPLLALDGFFLSDTDIPTGTGGVDIPELYSAGTVRVGATLNIGLAKLSGSGFFSFTGSIDLYDPNDDGKIRFSEIKSIVEKGSFLDIFNIKIKMCAGASFSVDIFNPFVNWKCKWYGCWPRGRWESVYSFSKSICFLEIDTTPPALPILAEVESSKLKLNMGSRAGRRLTGNTNDGGEYFTIRHVNGEAGSEEAVVLFGVPPASGQEDNRQAQEFTNYATYEADGARFGDKILLENPRSGGRFVGGNDAGQDWLILDMTGRKSQLEAGTITTTKITGFGIGTGGIIFSEFQQVHVRINNLMSSLTIEGVAAGTSLYVYLNGGNDVVTVKASSAIAGKLFIVGGSGQDTLNVVAQGVSTGSLTSTTVDNLGMTGTLTFSQMEVIRVTLSTGTDTFTVVSTPVGASVEIAARGGADTITVGSATVNDIVSPVKVDGAGGSYLIISDSLDPADTTGELTASRVTGLGMSSFGVLYTGFVQITVDLPLRGATSFNVSSTHPGLTLVNGGDQSDTLVVAGISGPARVYGGGGDDRLEIPLTIEGDTVINRISAPLTMDGQLGDDTYQIGFSGTGASRITLHDEGYVQKNGGETNVLVMDGTPYADTILFRPGFIACVHDAEAERVDVDRTINGGITVNGHNGDDTFATDGTSSIVTQNGGAGNDRFLIGQLYNSERVVDRMSEPGDVFNTTLTTEGYLSDGNGDHMNCNGESGEDSFVVMRNLGTLSLRGGIGNDRFTVRAFALASSLDKSVPDPNLGNTDVATDEGNDVVYYTVNAPVTIDGGPGFDTLVAIGTDLPDTFVVTRNGIYGAGLFITFTGIESVELATGAGDDSIYIMSTADNVKTNVFAGLGSDSVYVTPRYSVPVNSKDLRGHNGVIEHAVSSTADAAYDGLEAHGVTAYVTDQDSPSMVISSVNPLQLLETGSSSEQVGVYTIRMVHGLSSFFSEVTVNVVVPGAPSEIPNAASVTVSPNVLKFNIFNWRIARTVTVRVVNDRAPEGNEALFLAHDIVQLSNRDGYDKLKTPPLPVRIIDADQAEMYVLKPDHANGMRISESGLGPVGKSVTYDVLLKPCVASARPQDVSVSLRYNTSQATASPSTFSFASGSNCRQTVTVTATDDQDVEGFHFVAIYHDVTGSNTVYRALSLETVNIEILDDDAPGLVVLESHGATEVVEGDEAGDTYLLYLTQKPAGDVVVDVNVAATLLSWGGATTKKQLTVSPAQVTFKTNTYAAPATITVQAIVDELDETAGEETQQFASQPALAYQIQGPLTVGGGAAPAAEAILKAVKYPGETDIEAFPGQTNPWLTVREEEQVDRLVVENTGGFLPTTVSMSNGRITGMGMGNERVLGGETVLGGIQYYDFEEVVLNLGPAVDTVLINGTAAGTTYVNGGKGNDHFVIRGADGPVVLDGSLGADRFDFGDEAGLMGGIKDLVAVSGGAGTDAVAVNNGGGNALGAAGFLSRTELTGLGMYPARDSSSVAVQLVAVRGVSGTFSLSFSVDGKVYNESFAVGASGASIQERLQAVVLPNKTSCGVQMIAQCVQSFRVDKLGGDSFLYVVRYTGELATSAVSEMSVDTTHVVGASVELLAGLRHDAHPIAAGIAYVGMESLDIDLGITKPDVLNVRGTSVPTAVRTHGGDDTVVVASDALVLNTAAAQAVTFVSGRLDYVEGPLSIDIGETGRGRLLVSDSVGTTGREAAVLEAGKLTGFSPATITFTGADYTRGISVWLGAEKDTVLVSGTYGPDVNGTRTVTSVFTGPGNDTLTVSLQNGRDGFFVGGTEEGDDTIDASKSTLPLVLVGGTGGDRILSGLGGDIIFGDVGTALYGGVDQLATPRTTTAPLSGVAHYPSDVFTGTCGTEAEGEDLVTTSGYASNIVFGGGNQDKVYTENGDDVLLGDFGIVRFTDGNMTRVESICTTEGGNDTLVSGRGRDIVIGGRGHDDISGGTGDDLLAGDHATVLVVHTGKAKLPTIEATLPDYGDDDVIRASYGNDIVMGGPGADKVWAGPGHDVVFGDHGILQFTTPTDYTFEAVSVTRPESTGTGDKLFGETGRDLLMGGQGDDLLQGGTEDDWLFGDHATGNVTFIINAPPVIIDVPVVAEAHPVHSSVQLEAFAPVRGNTDVIEGEEGDDLLVGGHGEDILLGGNGTDVMFGDYGHYEAKPGFAWFYSVHAASLGGSDTIVGADGDDYAFGGISNDTIYGNAGVNALWGDHGSVTFRWEAEVGVTHAVPPVSFRTVESISPSDGDGTGDTLYGGDLGDFMFGGRGADTLHGGKGDNVMFGDHGAMNYSITSIEYGSVFADVPTDGGVDTIFGGSDDDTVFGGQAGDTIDVYGGNNRVFGDFGHIARNFRARTDTIVSTYTEHGGVDTITAKAGNQLVFGGVSGDNITTEGGDDVVFGDNGRVSYAPGETTYASVSPEDGGDDTIDVASGKDVVFGGIGSDVIDAGKHDDVVFGDHGSVELVGEGDITLFSIETNETVGGADTITAGSGEDTVFGGQDGDTIDGNEGKDVVFGDHGNVTIRPGTNLTVVVSISEADGGADTIRTHTGDDVVFGGADGDDIQTHSGDDVVFGDHGQVQLQYGKVQLTSTAPSLGGEDTIATDSGNDTVLGGAEADSIDVSTGDDVVFGDHGSVTIAKGDTLLQSVFTDPEEWGGPDSITGAHGNDILFGGQAGDNMTGDSGADWVFGDHGRVHLRPKAATHTLLESIATIHGGADTIDTHDGKDYVFGGQAGDHITTSTEEDVVFGDHGKIELSVEGDLFVSISTENPQAGGRDVVDSGADADLVFGGQDNDVLRTQSGDDTVFGDHGEVTVEVEGPVQATTISVIHGGSDEIHSGSDDDIVFGGAVGDEVHAGTGDDVVFGDHGKHWQKKNNVRITSIARGVEDNGGNDKIWGEAGEDIIIGGQADDVIYGQAGDDWIFGDHARVSLGKKQTLKSFDEKSGGKDTIYAGDNNDYVVGGEDSDAIFGGEGIDHIFGDSASIEQDKKLVGTRTFTSEFTASKFGGGDRIEAGPGDDFVVGQQGDDWVSGGTGQDMVFGDQAEAEMQRANHTILWARTIDPVEGIGGDDVLYGDDGDDYLFGGAASDTLHGGNNFDVLLGDHALFNGSFRVEHQYKSIYTGDDAGGANDTLHGDDGDDVLLGQQGDDVLYGGAGDDDLTGGHDVLDGSDGSDTIHGDGGADVVLGDNGLIDRLLYVHKEEPAPVAQTPVPLARVPAFCRHMSDLVKQEGEVEHPGKKDSGSDDGDDDDRRNRHGGGRGRQYGPNEELCWKTECVGESVTLKWKRFATERRYDEVHLYTLAANGTYELQWSHSGYSLPHRQPQTYSQDVIVRFSSDGYVHDLGFEFEYECSAPTAQPATRPPAPQEDPLTPPPPFVHSIQWERYPGAQRYADVVRLVQRFDDVDVVAGDDIIYGGDGDDILHGQRGDDTIDGGADEDELFGELGDDVLRGGAGADVVIGDMGHVVRALTDDGQPQVHPGSGVWHRNVVLEEQARFTKQYVETWRDARPLPREAAKLLQADVLLSMGGYLENGQEKKLEVWKTRKPWRTAVAGLELLRDGDDTLEGNDGDDVLIGQRGNDRLHGGAGDDFLYGDTVSSVYHYDSCLPLVTTVVRVLRESRDAEPWKFDIPFFGHVTHIPVWLGTEQSGRADAMRPIDDSSLSTLLPEEYVRMLETVGAQDLRVIKRDVVMRPFVAITPDVVRHEHEVSGNDELDGGDGNDLLVGDSAFHHALVNLRVRALDALRERTSARWVEIQFRLARLSTDAGTYEAQEGKLDLPKGVKSGNDRLRGGAGNDVLVGDRLEAFTDVVYHTHFTEETLEKTVKSLMNTYADYEVLAVDLQHLLFEAHHAVVQHLLAEARRGKAAPEVQLYLSNDNIDGGAGDDFAIGDSLVLMTKGLFLNSTHSGNYFTAVDWGDYPKGHKDKDWDWDNDKDWDRDWNDRRGHDDDHHNHGKKNPFYELLEDLSKDLSRHVKYDFYPSDWISGGNLKRRDAWNKMPYTKWGSDVIHGGDGSDSILGDYGLVVVPTFEGDPFHPSSQHGLQSIRTALQEHLHFVSEVVKDRLTQPAQKWKAAALQDQSFDRDMRGLKMYHDKGRGSHGHDEPESSPLSDTLYGDAGGDVMSDSNAVAVAPMWRPTNQLVVDFGHSGSRHGNHGTDGLFPPREFVSLLDDKSWRRMREYESRDRSTDEDVLTGGHQAGERDVVLVENLKEDRVTDKEKWVDSIYYRPAYSYLAEDLRDSYVGAVHGTCLNELARDGVVSARTVHRNVDLPVWGWHGVFGVVWTKHGIREPHYHAAQRRHADDMNKKFDKKKSDHDDDKDKHDDDDDDDDDKHKGKGKGNGKGKHDCGKHDSWKNLCKCHKC
eukprot:TRINITY_DN527_c0_g1_i2.p1 TRINITY_DN527_c0_g1~~TRINITY_DN527_c0_g1_i2.p1  ORF type:complete len:7344 (+),score=2902.47 TRINITY_DN527_c0_g1_i2:122-22153(+)